MINEDENKKCDIKIKSSSNLESLVDLKHLLIRVRDYIDLGFGATACMNLLIKRIDEYIDG